MLNGKYVNALPLYRMEYDFECLGAPISRQNMANWTMRAWELWLSRLRARMKELLLAGGIVHADETEVQVLREPGREAGCKSRMWLFAAPACARPIYIYEYNPTRGRQDGRRPHNRHLPVGLLRRRGIGSLSEFSRNEMGKL